MTSQEANSIPLGDILSHYGYEPSRRYGGYDMYRSPFRSDTSPSFKVFREENRWYDFGDGTYGRAVDLVMRVENCSFPQAMKELGRMRTSPQLSMPSIRKPETVSGRLPAAAPMTVLKVIPVQNRHLLDYAASRGIDGEIVRKYCVEVHYCFERNPREKYALGFANDHRGFELRNSMFKGCAYAKDITCISEGNRSCAFAYLNGEFKYKPNPEKDNWTGDWEKVSGDALAGTLDENGAGNIDAPEAGFYMMEVDLTAMTYKHTLISTLGVIGSATPSGWDADTDMTYNEEDGSWNLTTNLTDGEIKIRANNDWDINWGGSIAEPTFNAGNIAVTAGNYTIRFIPQCDGMNLLTLTKN